MFSRTQAVAARAGRTQLPTGVGLPLPLARTIRAFGIAAHPRLWVLTASAWLFPLILHVWRTDPSTWSGPLRLCVWLATTGFYCPGCGMTRAVHDLMHGRVIEALEHNLVGVILLLGAGVLYARPLIVAVIRDRWSPPALPRNIAWWILGTGLVWAIVRNLPWAPFERLAP